MSTPDFPKEGMGGGPQGRSNTWIVVLVVAVVLAIPALCVCGGLAAVVLWPDVREQPDEFPEPRRVRPDSDLHNRSPVLPPAPEEPQPVVDEPQTGTTVPDNGQEAAIAELVKLGGKVKEPRVGQGEEVTHHRQEASASLDAPDEDTPTMAEKDDYSWEEFERDLKVLDARFSLTTRHSMEGEVARAEIYGVLGKLCPMYLQADASSRERIRKAFGDRRPMADLAWKYTHHIADKIHSAEDVQWLRHGLAAISIENSRVDYRDTLMAMAKLYVRAEQAGIDPQPHFEAVAEMSSTAKPRGGSEPVANMLRDLHKNEGLLAERRRGLKKNP